jgi:uncharacterized protein with HEPN domain
MSPDDRSRPHHVVDALNSAIRFARGRDRKDLDSDEMLLFALVRAIEVAGEAASRVSAETRAELTAIPWDSMIGMRNRLVHAYFDINHDILWTTVTEAAPPLVERVSKALADE